MQFTSYPSSRSRPLLFTLAALVLIVALLLNVLPGYAQDEAAEEVFNASISAPSHIAPTSEAITTALTDPPVGVPSLQWSSVPGATQYNVQISTSQGFATTVVNQNTVATSFTPKVALADGTYFWRVRAQVDRAWGNFSEPWSFHKQWSADGAVKPLLLTPANDPEGQHVITSFGAEHFSWEPVEGAASYRLEISVSPSFNDSKPYRVTTLKTHHTPTQQFANNQYYWRVIPLDAKDNPGEPSEVRTFTFGWNQVPKLLTPDDDITARFLPRFTWEAVEGASSYVLEISSQENFSAIELSIATRNTSYTPEKSLGNNKDYFWRVRAVSPQKVNGSPSEVRSFRTEWVKPPTQLSPPAHSIQHIYPYFSWTPVPGAERYQIQIASGTGFDNLIVNTKLYNATSYTQPEWKEINFDGDVFWRVRAEDAQGNTTAWSSEISFRFVKTPPPNLIYPEPYYVPDAEELPVHTDRTIAHPVFVWDTTHQYNSNPDNKGNGPTAFIYPDFYRLEVATSLDFSNIVFSIDSAGNAAAPTKENAFSSLVDGSIYYWRVTPYRSGMPMAPGTIWQTRIDRTIQSLPFDSDSTPDISHPQDGAITIETAPVLGWLPVAGAHHYKVEISANQDFSEIVDVAHPLFAYYAPWQGRQTPIPTGHYWWRVQAQNEGDEPLGDWSESRHFFVMGKLMTGSDYDYKLPETGTLRNAVYDPLTYDPMLSMVATDTNVSSTPYEVGPLHVVQDRSLAATNRNWVIAFGAANDVSGSLTYALYFDVNQQAGMGGSTDPRGKPINFDPFYLPDYVIYLERTDNSIVGGSFYVWNKNGWESGPPLANLGGQYTFDAASSTVQVTFPYATIIRQDSDNFSGGVALTVYSTGSGQTDGPVDSVPYQGATMNRPALFSNMPVPLYPFDTPLSNPIVFHELPTLRWRMPHFNSTDGYIVQVARNPDFTEDTIVETWETFENNTGSYYGGMPTAFHSGKSYNDDESYYWRVRYRHERYGRSNEYDVSPWSQPMRFKLSSYKPGNPTVTLGNAATGEPAYATPSFTWDRVEGAARYTIQIDDDFNMNSPLIDKTIDGNSYTSLDTLADGTYYWRVALRRSDKVLGQWTSIISFTKSSLVPTPISPTNGVVINDQPTFEWSAAISNTGELRVAAPRYRLQWANNPQFNNPTTVETEATSYTPVKGQSLSDGTWYWRVAVIDGNNRRGPDSPTATFYKEYLKPLTIAPVQGSVDTTTLTFEWEPLEGAASYKLEIANNEAFDKPISVTTDNTRYTHTEKLPQGDYYWRVQMIDKDGKPGPTIPGRFSQGPAQPVTPEQPDGPAVYIPYVLAP